LKTVAKFQFLTEERCEDSFLKTIEILDTWADKKFDGPTPGPVTIRKSGRTAQYSKTHRSVTGMEQDYRCIEEPIPQGMLQTTIYSILSEEKLSFHCTLRISSQQMVRDPDVPIFAPRFIKEVLGQNVTWITGQNLIEVSANPLSVSTSSDVDALRRVLRHGSRTIPLILISEVDGDVIASDAHEKIAADLAGVAHVCRISSDASWELTQTEGKVWSCFNGGIRLFWPIGGGFENPRTHPLWTYERIMRGVPDERAALNKLRNYLSEVVFEASAYVADDEILSIFEKKHDAERFDKLVKEAGDVGDYEKIVELYSQENRQLKHRIIEIEAENKNLQENLRAFEQHFQNARTLSPDDQPSVESPGNDIEDSPLTVQEAYDAFLKKRNSKIVAFSNEIEESISTLATDAGPPDKIRAHLDALEKLGVELSKAPSLGKSIPNWLKEINVECSGDSETVQNSKPRRLKRTFNFDGREVYCEFHTKVKEKVSADRCPRIYFSIQNCEPYILIGYIGKHFD